MLEKIRKKKRNRRKKRNRKKKGIGERKGKKTNRYFYKRYTTSTTNTYKETNSSSFPPASFARL
jgi:hypothetical protein